MLDQTPWLDSRLFIAPSPIAGLGLFAREAIEEGTIVVRLGGEVLTDDELLAAIRDRALQQYSSLSIDDNLNLLIADDSPTNFGNHSCDANLWMVDAVTLSTKRPIAAGEEVTVDYATHTADIPWSMTCACGSSVCRHVITSDDWKRPDVQDRYAGHFSPFLNRRISTSRPR